MTAAASAAAASAVVTAAGYDAPASFFCRTPGSVVALYAAAAKSYKENGDKAAYTVFKAAQRAAATA